MFVTKIGVCHLKDFLCLFLVGKGRRQKVFNNENFPIYSRSELDYVEQIALLVIEVPGKVKLPS